MDTGLAALIGSVVGTLGALSTTWLGAYLSKKKPDRAEQAAKHLLEVMLNRPPWRWSRLDTLSKVIGSDEATTRRLLLEIGARGSMRDGRAWGLISRNPIKPNSMPELEPGEDDPDPPD